MPRDLALGNGRLLVTFDATYTLRDLYFPHVGRENHTLGHACRTGVWVAGQFAWLSDEGWQRRVTYRPDSLVSDVTLDHAHLQLHIRATDAVHCEYPLLLRSFEVTNLSDELREVRLFFHQDLHISENEIGDTAAYEPVNRSLGHYKGRRYFVMNGRTGDGQGIFQYAIGFKDSQAGHGTWRDAEDGWLEMNPIAQGAVDSTISFRQNIPGGETRAFHYWLGAEKDYWEARSLNLLVLGEVRTGSITADERKGIAVTQMIGDTDAYWRSWTGRAPPAHADLPNAVQDLYRRSLLVIATQIDHQGAIIAANDGDSMRFNRDSYSYMWPRDGALVARALDRCGYSEITERFFRFCAALMPKAVYYPEGYLMHKFHADGSLGSSWHPWVRDGRPSLPIQEDETALVLWAFWHHLQQRRPADSLVFNLLQDLTPRFVVPAARFMLLYRDEAEGRERFRLGYPHPPTGLPLASYDLWEERYGIHAFTVVAVIAGLVAARKLLQAAVEQGGWIGGSTTREAPSRQLGGTTHFVRDDLIRLSQRCWDAAERMKAAFQKFFWSSERRSYGRMVTFEPDGIHLDTTLDSSTLYALTAFDVFGPDEPGVRESIDTIVRRLWCKTPVGGVARYENDYYHRQSDDLESVPGNPWVICTLWSALGQIFLARPGDEQRRPLEILEWCCRYARPSGVLAEQVHPSTGAAMSVAPLTWSHSTFVETVLAYTEKTAMVR